MAVRTGGQAPYAPPTTVLDLIRAYRNRGIPTPFTKEVLVRAGVPDSLVVRTMQALRLLDLVDESGNPTQEFEGLRRAGESEFPSRLEGLVRTAYADIFQYVDPATDSEERVRDQFRHCEPLGQLNRMVKLFLGLCEAAGITAANPARKRPTPSPDRAARNPSPKKPARRQDDEAAGAPKNPPTIGGDIPAAIAGLLATLPKNGSGWPKTRRDAFIATFTAVLDFVVPVREQEPDADE